MTRICTILAILITSFCAAQEFEGISNPVKISFTEREINAPDIFLVYLNSGQRNTEGLVEVHLRILDESGIAEVRVNQEQVVITQPDTLVLSYTFTPGQEVEVFARDQLNNVREKSFIVQAASPTETITPVSAESRFHALLIAVNDYQDESIVSLTEPIQDANLLKNVLVEKYTFKEENIRLLRNPTYEQMIVAFENLSREIGPSDLLLVFYAGHGVYNEKTNIGYWLPTDAQKANTARWFRNSALVENIGAINSKHTLLISDACFGGSIFRTRSAFNNASIDIANLLKRTSRKAMTSGSLTTVPDKSVFMRYLLKSLTDNPNKYLTSEDLFDEVRIGMRNNSTTRPLFGEIQNVGDEGGNFVFIRKD